ncbi:MAG: hypothetical protein FK730_08490 [Asgard group archaeon]|nr:hypothetical protein [Asgard group archaeon]
MKGRITLDDLILIFGEDFIPPEIDRKILMKHFEVGANRIIGEKTVDKVKQVLLTAIETARSEQFKNRGGVIESPAARLSSRAIVNSEMLKDPTDESTKENNNNSSIEN